MFYEIMGLSGSLGFAISTWPQAVRSLRTKSTEGISVTMMFFYLIGGFFSTVYGILTHQYILLPNFIFGTTGMLVVFLCHLRYEVFKRGL